MGANIFNTNNGVLTVKNSLIAYPGTNGNVVGPIIDGGYNISSDSSANFSSGTSFNFTDPKLLPLANNGGPTRTMALASNSPAIDWAPVGGAPTTDQRGLMRPFGAGIDLGAFEYGAALPPLSTQRNGVMLNIWFSGQAGVNYRIEKSTNLFSWEMMENTGAMSTNGTVLRSYPTVPPLGFYRLTLGP
ncbi:MAG: hypothetical protein H7X97_13795 [Opitutaceae bacterium]|nr:hypothetical protein [Verrucomicrobiales bacterium]